MSYEVIGLRRSEGTSKKTNRPYAGFIVFYEFTVPDTQGFACDSVFISDSVLNGEVPVIGDQIKLNYDRNGYLISCDIL